MGGRRTADIAGLQPVRLRGREIHLDLYIGLLDLTLDTQVGDTIDVRDALLHFPGQVGQHFALFALNTHDYGLARPGQDLADSVRQVALC